MIIDLNVARYVAAVVVGVRDRWITPDEMTNECPECSRALGYLTTDDHIAVDMKVPGDPEWVAVIVGCEGYLVVNPARVGMADVFPNWTDTTGNYPVCMCGSVHVPGELNPGHNPTA